MIKAFKMLRFRTWKIGQFRKMARLRVLDIEESLQIRLLRRWILL